MARYLRIEGARHCKCRLASGVARWVWLCTHSEGNGRCEGHDTDAFPDWCPLAPEPEGETKP